MSEEMHALCDKLGLEYESVKSLFSTPVEITAVVFKKNENGHKYVIEALQEPATEELTIPVKT